MLFQPFVSGVYFLKEEYNAQEETKGSDVCGKKCSLAWGRPLGPSFPTLFFGQGYAVEGF